MNIFKSKKFKHGSLSVIFTVIFVAAIVLVNIIFNLVLDRFNVTVDLSDASLYSIDATTTDYLAALDKHIEIIVTAEESDYESTGNYYKQTNQIINRFAASSPNVTVTYLDLLSNPTVYSDYGSTISAGDLIVKCTETGIFKVITSSDYLQASYYMNGEEITYEEAYYYYYAGYSSYITETVEAGAEIALLSGIMYVTNEDPVRVAFLTGYSETTSTTFTSLLEKNAYATETLDITLAQSISSDIDYLVLYAPVYDYSAADLTKIDEWLDNGGTYGKNIIYIPNTSSTETPNFDAFLKTWGIEVGESYIYQTDANYSNSSYQTYQVLELQDSSYSAGIDVSTKATYGDAIRPITLLFEESSKYATTSIIKTYDGAVLRPFTAGDAWKTSDATEIAAYDVFVESVKATYIDNVYAASRVFVYGGPMLINDTFLSASQANNAEILMNVFNITSGKEDVEITLTPKSFSLDTFEISSATANVIAIVFAIVLPLAIVTLGIVVWARRRRR